jgi:hypothetical protein
MQSSPDVKILKHWPSHGLISFRNFTNVRISWYADIVISEFSLIWTTDYCIWSLFSILKFYACDTFVISTKRCEGLTNFKKAGYITINTRRFWLFHTQHHADDIENEQKKNPLEQHSCRPVLYICSCLYGLVSLCKSYLRLYFVRICFMYYLSLE